VRLLERTTRPVNPTLDGEAYHRRCPTLIADVEEAEPPLAAPNRRDYCAWMFTARWRGIL
jgi:DNA-binding transcriptional LysR family regulator